MTTDDDNEFEIREKDAIENNASVYYNKYYSNMPPTTRSDPNLYYEYQALKPDSLSSSDDDDADDFTFLESSPVMMNSLGSSMPSSSSSSSSPSFSESLCTMADLSIATTTTSDAIEISTNNLTESNSCDIAISETVLVPEKQSSSVHIKRPPPPPRARLQINTDRRPSRDLACVEKSSGMSSSSVYSGNSVESADALNMRDIVVGKDVRTAVMLKNVPNRYTQEMLLDFINETHRGTFDFFYLRMDFVNNCNVGYAFINFIDPLSIVSFSARITGQKWPKFKSSKVPILVPAKIQSKAQFIDQFRNSPVMLEPIAFRPRLFCSDGVGVGLPMEFPGPNGDDGGGAGGGGGVRARSDHLFSRSGAMGFGGCSGGGRK
ncbi:RNA recognition motif 2-domain-containing protein [Obelidium mucronatum]|nr:RNA recognition motif 2-domain-containing protein [Obelidium mucronatum]